MQEAVKAGIKKIAIVSDIESGIHLGRNLRQIEKYTKDSQMYYTFIHPNWSYQAFGILTAQEIQNTGKFSTLPLEEAKISWCDARDVAEATIKVITGKGHENKSYNLTGPESLSCYEMAKILSRELLQEVIYTNPSLADALELIKTRKILDADIVDEISEWFKFARDGLCEELTLDIQSLTGYPPRGFSEWVDQNKLLFLVNMLSLSGGEEGGS